MSVGIEKIGQIAVVVRDSERATRFYRDVLGLKFLFAAPPKLAFFDCGGVRLFLSQGDGEDSASILYFRVANIHAAHEELRARGVEFTDAPHMIHKHADGTEEWMNFFKDDEGRPLAIMAQVKA